MPRKRKHTALKKKKKVRVLAKDRKRKHHNAGKWNEFDTDQNGLFMPLTAAQAEGRREHFEQLSRKPHAPKNGIRWE